MAIMESYFKRIIFCVLFGSALILSTRAEEESKAEVEVLPKEYDLYIETTEDHFKDNPNEDAELRFFGTVDIIFELSDPKSKNFEFKINIIPKTEIQGLTLFGIAEDGELSEIDESEDKEEDNFKYTIDDNYINGSCSLVQTYSAFRLMIDFTNPFQNDMSGFYRSSYSNKDGKKRWLLTTHFEPIYARRAFPCFDKPHLKATYKVEIAIPKQLKNYHVLCNSPVDFESEEGGHIVVQCAKTSFPMSTYLVAFTVSDFARTSTLQFMSNYPESYPRDIVTYGRKDIIDNGDAVLSQKAAKEAITLLGNYLEKGYALEKIDQAGIPDFAAGAMENWGLISYREKMLFFNEAHGAVTTKQSVVSTITHELVHQWFGNLVTLKSWDYIWLNEAFATYLSYMIANEMKNPKATDWGYMKQVLVNEVHSRAFERDGLETARSLSHKHQDEKLVSASFDDISYAKGCSVLRMWDLSLKNDGFRKSLVDYIENNAKKSVTPEDLYKSLKKVANMNEKFFKDWHEKPGYPVVEVKKNGDKYTLTQNRFLWEKPTKAKEMVTYEVPITFAESNSLQFSTYPEIWLRSEAVQLDISSPWFIINNQQAGYYRVNYENENWMALAEALLKSNHSSIHEFNRAQIINDVFSLARSLQKDYVNYSTALHTAQFLKNESSYIVWKSALNAFEFLRSKLSHEDETYNPFKKYVLNLVEPHFKKFVNFGGNHLDRLLASHMSRVACSLDYEPCIQEAKELYSVADKYPNAEEVILCTVASTDNSAWKEVYEKYKTEKESSRKLMFLSVLGCTTDTEVAEKFLNKTLKLDTSIRKQDLLSAFVSVYRGPHKNVEVAFRFLEKNFETMAKEYGGMNPIGRAIAGIATKLHTQKDVERMEALINKIKASPTTMVPPESLDNALIIVKNNVEWITKRTADIRKYFSSHASNVHASILLLSFICSFFIFNF